MFMPTLLLMVLSLVGLLPTRQQPLPSGMLLLTLALVSVLLLGYSIQPWYGYTLFLIYISGVLVVFAYVCAMTPNPFFPLQTKTLSAMIFLWASSALMFLSNTEIHLLSPYFPPLNWELNLYPILHIENLSVFWLTGVMLLMALIITVYIAFKKSSPLRPFEGS